MARLVLGTDKSIRIPAIVKEVQTPMPLSIQRVKDANGKVVGGNTIIDLNGATDVGTYALAYAYYTNTNITGIVDFSSLTTISGAGACNSMFNGAIYLTEAKLSSLTTISGNQACNSMFNNCTSLASVDLSSLTVLSGANCCSQMFNNCSNITSVDLSSLTTISGSLACHYMFAYSSRLASVNLSSLNTITGNSSCNYMFASTSLTSLSFPALTSTSFGSNTNQFNNMLNRVIGCTVHFPSNLQSVIGSWSDVTNGFGGTNTTVLFDLPATN